MELTIANITTKLEEMEGRIAALEVRLSPEARKESGKLAFGGEPAVPEWEPAIPNTIFDIPDVPVRQAHYLAYIRHKDGKEGWYGLRPSGAMGEVVPYPANLKAVAEKCGIYREGSYTVVSFNEILSVDDEILRKVRNPFLPVPAGCKVADDEWSLIPG